ncbi:OprD family outer membrane porin [Campylobacter sp. 9BO]|uniref:OprD family outer membrane porin n=1 Tax=Campylobacter sp. 9BO TaxID=3424759 RepID=UPI003D34FBFA
MKLGKLSLVAAFALGGLSTVNAADTLAEAFTNGKLAGTVQAHYTDYTDERKLPKQYNENIFGLGLELGYVTDPFYGFRLGLSAQGWGSISPSKEVKTWSDKEWYANGFVLSEAYLGYTLGKTDIKAGRQYVGSPVVAGNPTRAFKEAFEGVSVKNTDIANTELFAGWFYKFQGRSKVATGSNDTGAPLFRDRVILGGLGPVAFEFDNIFTAAVANKSIEGLKLTAAYGLVTDVDPTKGMPPAKAFANHGKSDVNLIFAEASYTVPVSNFKLGFDVNYKGSRVDGWMDKANLDGDMLGLRVRLADLYGFSASYAYTRMGNDDLVFGAGNGAVSYTMLPIFGPYQWTGYAKMDTHKIQLGYDFGAVGVKGLSLDLHLMKGKQGTQSKATYSTKANEKMDIKGYSVQLGYNASEFVKGLSTNVTYTSATRENYSATGAKTEKDTQELWVKVAYKFSLLN